jgi:hypothetical protein
MNNVFVLNICHGRARWGKVRGVRIRRADGAGNRGARARASCRSGRVRAERRAAQVVPRTAVAAPWTPVNPADTGEILEAAIRLGAPAYRQVLSLILGLYDQARLIGCAVWLVWGRASNSPSRGKGMDANGAAV